MELPKLGAHIPDTNNERWAALFASAPDLTPESMASVPLSLAQREALELAREETFTLQERDAIDRSHEEVDQVRRTILAEAATAEARGEVRGEARGEVRGKCEALRALLLGRGFAIDEATHERIVACADLAQLDAWFARAITATTLAAVFDP